MDGVTSDSGVRFELDDASEPGSVDLMTENLTGTQPWTNEELDIVTGPQTHALALRIIRRASEHFGGKIDGTVWIDDVSLVRTAGPSGAPL